ncbi:MAG: leucine-rich repeat domain-containing protein [Muribaculaceae bacterium]|nr:leucine-rich repeat domain-containing protein [Muribaculaceae bacterium]
MNNRHLLRVMAAMLLVLVCASSANAQYGSRGNKRYNERYSRANTYGDIVEVRLSNPGTLEEKIPLNMVDRVRLLHIEGPMDSKDFNFIKKICKRSRCVDSHDRKIDNYLDLELERARIMSAGTKGLFGDSGERDVLGDALANCNHLRSIVLPERTKRIAYGALRGCSDLEEVIMPSGVRSLGDNAFSGCYSLEYITLNDGLESIGEECFSSCSRLDNINLPYSLVEIGKKAFKGTGLKRVSLPSRLRTLGAAAFEDTPITELDIPAETQIENNDLGKMKKLEEITVANGSRYYTYEDGVLYDNTGAVLLCCPAARTGSFMVPDGVEEIGRSAFAYSQLSGVNLPDGMNLIEADAFFECPQLKTVIIPASVKEIGELAFYGCSRLQQVDLSNVRKLGKKAFQDCKSLQSVVAGGLGSVPQSAFESCSALTSVKLSSEVTTIGEHAFKNCKALAQITLPDQLTTICKEAFENCALTSLELPEGLVTIGERAFKNCKGLTSVTVPDNCVTVDKDAFRECTSLVEIDLGKGLRFLGDNALRETAITTLILPETTSDVGKKVAEKCKNLTRIECHAIRPPQLGGVSNNKVELFVPASSIDDYRKAKNWKNFKNVEAL